MRTTTALTLGQAAKATGKSKATIARAIDAGKISATRGGDGSYAIEPAELFRVFEEAPRETGAEQAHGTADETVRNPSETGAVHRELELLREERERERRQYEETIADLRRRLDQEAEERRRTASQLAGLLTDHRQQGEVKERQEHERREEMAALRRELEALRQQQELANRTNKRRGWLTRMFGDRG